MEHIKKCPACNTYTFKDTCCSQKTVSAKPPRYSPEDPYKKWRQKARS